MSYFAALKDFLIRRENLDVKEILDVTEDQEDYGYCVEGTCWYTQVVLRISYRNSNNQKVFYNYVGDFQDIIKEL